MIVSMIPSVSNVFVNPNIVDMRLLITSTGMAGNFMISINGNYLESTSGNYLISTGV